MRAASDVRAPLIVGDLNDPESEVSQLIAEQLRSSASERIWAPSRRCYYIGSVGMVPCEGWHGDQVRAHRGKVVQYLLAAGRSLAALAVAGLLATLYVIAAGALGHRA